MTYVPHDRNPSFNCAGCEANGLDVEWPNGCPAAQERLIFAYGHGEELLMQLSNLGIIMGRFTDLPPAKIQYRLTHWTGLFTDRCYDHEFPTQRVGRPPSGAGPEPGRRMGSGSASPRG